MINKADESVGLRCAQLGRDFFHLVVEVLLICGEVRKQHFVLEAEILFVRLVCSLHLETIAVGGSMLLDFVVHLQRLFGVDCFDTKNPQNTLD